MDYNRQFVNLCIKNLAESMDVRGMTHLIRHVMPGYDLHEATGIPTSMAIANLDAARQIVQDVIERDLVLTFVQTLVSYQEEGRMGTSYRFPYLNELLKEVFAKGFLWDQNRRMFMENPRVRKTRNWGCLEEGESYTMAFLGVDIIGNSKLVRTYSPDLVGATYNDFKYLVQNASERRNARIWMWEGDGGVVAFFQGNPHQGAVLAAMEIINNLFLYNRTITRLGDPIQVRLTIHSGDIEYSAGDEEVKKSVVLKELMQLEQDHGRDGSIIISYPVKMMLDGFLSNQFLQLGNGTGGQIFRYDLRWEA